MTISREIDIGNCWKSQNVIINTLSYLHVHESGYFGHGRELWHHTWSENPTGNFPSSNAILRCLHGFSRQEVPKLPPEAHSSSIETSEGALNAGIYTFGTCWEKVSHFQVSQPQSRSKGADYCICSTWSAAITLFSQQFVKVLRSVNARKKAEQGGGLLGFID